MRFFASLAFLVSLASASAVGACSDKKKAEAPEEEAAPACETNADCAQGEVCLAKECANAAPGAIYTDPSSAVTPDKVRKEMEMINKAAEDRVNKMMEEAEGQ